jgi:outer membrane protein OmpA-like peptidoglycan-associated protein
MFSKTMLALALALLCGCAQAPSEHRQANASGFFGANDTAKASNSHWWSFSSSSKSKPQQSTLPVQAQQDALTQAWLDRYEQPLRTALEGSGFSLERRQDVLMISIPVSGSFNPDRPQLLMPAKLGPLTRIAKLHVADTQAPAVLILGHSDSSGQVELNRQLSQQRAQAVAGIFTLSGFKRDRMLSKGVGSDMPRAANDSAEGRARNRRVNILMAPPQTLLALIERYSKPSANAQIATKENLEQHF